MANIVYLQNYNKEEIQNVVLNRNNKTYILVLIEKIHLALQILLFKKINQIRKIKAILN